MQEIKGEKKYGINTTGADELKKLAGTGIDISHATIYMPVSYILLKNIFDQLPLKPRKHFLDIGCGKGRALCVAAYNHFEKVSGVDFSDNLCQQAKKNLDKIKQTLPSLQFSIDIKNAEDFVIPQDTDCIFLFNPFDGVIMEKVVNNIVESLDKKPRELDVVYANPIFKEKYLNAGFKETFHSKSMKYFEVSIMHFRH